MRSMKYLLVFFTIAFHFFPQQVFSMTVEEFFDPEEENDSMIEFVLSSNYKDILVQIQKATEYNEKARNVDSIPKIESNAKLALYFSANALRLLKQEKVDNQNLRKMIENNVISSFEILGVDKPTDENIMYNCTNQIELAIKNNIPKNNSNTNTSRATSNGLIEFVKNSNASSNTANGRSFPVLKATKRDFKMLDDAIYKELIRRSEKLKSTKDPIEIHKIFIESWAAVGFSLDATFRDTFKNITPKQYLSIANDGTFNCFLTIINLFKNKETRFQVQSATPSPWVLASSKKTS